MKVAAKDKNKKKIEVSPSFIVTTDEGRGGAPHMMIHADGHDSDTLDFTVIGNKIVPWFTNTDASGMNFGEALECLMRGDKVAREGWNGNGMYLIYVAGTNDVKPTEGSAYADAGLVDVDIGAHIDMLTTNGKMQPGWLASQADMLAGDWLVVVDK